LLLFFFFIPFFNLSFRFDSFLFVNFWLKKIGIWRHIELRTPLRVIRMFHFFLFQKGGGLMVFLIAWSHSYSCPLSPPRIYK
jgi:hypothetical protein